MDANSGNNSSNFSRKTVPASSDDKDIGKKWVMGCKRIARKSVSQDHIYSDNNKSPEHGRKGRFEEIIADLEFEKLKGVRVFNEDDDDKDDGDDDDNDNNKNKWYAAEELLLLTALQYYGFGNWTLASEILTKYCEKEFTAEEVEDHYNETYMKGPMKNGLFDAHVYHFLSPLVDHTLFEDGEESNEVDVPDNEEFLNEIGNLPLTDELTVEYDEETESLLDYMKFDEEDDEYDKNMNFIILDEFRHRINVMMKNNLRSPRVIERYYSSLDPPMENEMFQKTLLIDDYPLAEYLSEEEKDLCVELKLRPLYYIYYKAFLRQVDALRQNGEDIYVNLMPAYTSMADCVRIVDFLTENGWIQTPNLLNLADY